MSAADPSPVVAAQEVADRVLRPQAERADVEGVRREVVDAVAAAGLLGLAGPREAGGADAPAAVQREVTELLAGADGATWFVTTQHTTPLLAVAGSGNEGLRERVLPGLCGGELLAGVAVTHLRRRDRAPVTAQRVDGGWRVDGRVSWATSWGLADLLLLAALSADGEVVQAVLPAREQPGLRAGAPLRLAAMQGTRTVQLELDGLRVADADVAGLLPVEQWREADRLRTANATAASFGLLQEVVRRLRERAETAGGSAGGPSAAAADAFGAEGRRLRARAYALVDEVPAAERLEERLAVRGAALALLQRAAAALVAAGGGAGLSLDAAPQRLAREALFHLVQAQTPPVRETTLQALAP